MTMIVLGSSVSAGEGTLVYNNSWVPRVFAWVQQAFPHSGHLLQNLAAPGTSSAYLAPCVLDMVPPSADIVFIEYRCDSGAGSMRCPACLPIYLRGRAG